MKVLSRAGEWAMGALLVSVVSGFVVGYQYEAADPLTSTVAMEAVMPYGAFWRSLHFWSSQIFVLLLLVHLLQSLDDLPRYSAQAALRRRWAILSVTFPMAVYALFSGYVLRYDGTGRSAGAIAEHLLLDVPVIGGGLDRLLVGLNPDGLNRLYLVHILMAALLWGLGSWYHTRRVILGPRIWWSALAGCVGVAILFHAPLEPQGANALLIKGPWFFLGVQELLRYFPPVAAGVLFPLFPLAVLTALPWLSRRRAAFGVLAGWVVIYALATLRMILR